jgi:hypothetical protein
MYVSINKQLTIFQICFGISSRLCQGSVRSFFFFLNFEYLYGQYNTALREHFARELQDRGPVPPIGNVIMCWKECQQMGFMPHLLLSARGRQFSYAVRLERRILAVCTAFRIRLQLIVGERAGRRKVLL